MRGRPQNALGENALQLWRCIRDAGRNGMLTTRLQDKHLALDGQIVRSALGNLKTAGYIAQPAGARTAYVVDADCKVPAGESAHLGPGWDEADEDVDAAKHAAATTSLAPAIGARSAWPFGPQTNASQEEKTLEVATASTQHADGFVAALASDGTLQMTLRVGVRIALDRDECRALLAYLARISGASLLEALPQEAS